MTSSVQDTYDVTDMPPAIGTALAVRPVEMQSVQDVRAAMALKDDEQVMQACHGAMIKEWMYSFKIGDKEVSGLSVVGAAEVARIRAEAGFPIRFPVVLANDVEQNGRVGIRVQVTARDQRSGGESIAMVFEPYFDDKGRANPFVERKALSKAKRNAILDLVPETQVLALLRAAKESASGRVGRKPMPARREVAREVVEAVPAPQAPPVQMLGADAYHLAPSNEAQMAQIAQLAEHPSNRDVKKNIAAGLDNKIYDTYAAAQDCIERLQKRIMDSKPAA